MRTKALLVDDVEINRQILCEIMKEEYSILEAENGKQAVALLEQYHEEIAVVLLDIMMPEMDGFEVLDNIKQNGWMGKIPVLFITGEASTYVELRGFEKGISDLIRKPFNAKVVKNRVKNIVDLFAHKNLLEDKVDEQTQKLKEQNKTLKEQAEKLKERNTKIIDILGSVVEYRDLESGAHINRVKGFTEILANHMMKEYPEYGLEKPDVEVITTASALHDIGKIAISDSILLKPGKLTKEEFELMKTHTTKGFDILKNIEGIWDEEYRKVSCEICRHHHERYDGRGYPDGLKGDEIPISAQLVSIADVYDALVSARVYKSAFAKDEAYDMIQKGECGVFSPKLLESLKHAKAEFEQLADEYR